MEHKLVKIGREKFIKENNIEHTNIKDIKFSVDSKGNEYILLIYEVPEE